MKSLTYLLSFLVEGRSTLCVIPTTPPFNSNHESISSSSLHTQIRKRRRPHRQSSSKAHPHNSIHPHTTPTRQKQHQKTNTSPTIPFTHFVYFGKSRKFKYLRKTVCFIVMLNHSPSQQYQCCCHRSTFVITCQSAAYAITDIKTHFATTSITQ